MQIYTYNTYNIVINNLRKFPASLKKLRYRLQLIEGYFLWYHCAGGLCKDFRNIFLWFYFYIASDRYYAESPRFTSRSKRYVRRWFRVNLASETIEFLELEKNKMRHIKDICRSRRCVVMLLLLLLLLLWIFFRVKRKDIWYAGR